MNEKLEQFKKQLENEKLVTSKIYMDKETFDYFLKLAKEDEEKDE